ncbi:HDOD domain protein [Tepidimonas thermarum]|uniref:HDOD domain protein n=1 Tax=Tepidimonas thermarum TaxID=335431 RepID=A0A554X3W4_9BURK|nr:HDOD domain-containing protein [Tepidimonas thermarum]TSE30529.1 HDOD domain protein [Tepidimonas thermarum]
MGADHPRLAALLGRLRANADFPALSAQVQRVQQLARDDKENLHRLADEVLKDVALTQKLLRVVNSAPYVANRGGASTVSRAISLLGLSAVSNIASSLVLLERWEGSPQAQRVCEAYARALLAANVAADLCGTGPEREEVFLAALFQGLGRLLAVCFFPEEAERIHAEAQGDPAREHAAVVRHLGVSYDSLALAVAQEWGLPDVLRRTTERPTGPVPARPPQDRAEWVRWVAAAGTDVADGWVRGAATGDADAMDRLANRYSHLVGQPPQALKDAAGQARQRFLVTAQAVGLMPSLQTADWAAWLGGGQTPPPRAAADAGADTVATPGTEQVPPAEPARAQEAPADSPALLLGLAQGLQDATAALLDGNAAAVRLDLGLESLHLALGLQRMWLVTPGADGVAAARLSLGEGARALAAVYRVALANGAHGTGDLLAALGRLRQDSWIADPFVPRLFNRLPLWYRSRLAPRTAVLMLPLWKGERWLGWIHADGPAAALSVLGPAERALLRAQRNLMITALLEAPPP